MPTYSNINLNTSNKGFGLSINQFNLRSKGDVYNSRIPDHILKSKIKKLLFAKPILVSVDDLNNLPDTSLDGFNGLGFNTGLVGYDPSLEQLQSMDKPVSPRVLNWVEPYEISGIRKTLFYTEVNSGLKVGDRVFIINGSYDSDLLIQSDKYKKGRDGYKILYIDKCQVVLDIDYTGELPYMEDEVDNFVKIYYVRDADEFLHINRQITTRGGNFAYKFSYNQNNFIFTDIDFPNPTLPGSYWGQNLGLTNSPGFFVRDDNNSSNNGTYSWSNITNDFINNGTYSYATANYDSNNRVKIYGGSFEYSGQEFKEGFVYKWEVGPTMSKWVVDVRYSMPILTKGNFRDGNFDGVFNTGLYGRQNKRIKWTGNKSSWKTGTLLNTIWEKGTFESKFTLADSYFTEYDQNGLPYVKVNSKNNNDRGFNFIIDSQINTSVIENATIINSIIGTGSTYSAVENHILGNTIPYKNQIKKAYLEDSDFNGVSIENSEIKNVRSYNSQFNNIKSINSYYKSSTIKNSDYISDEIIKINGYDELIFSENKEFGQTYSISPGASHKIYKFYINKKDYQRFKDGDSFYIKGLEINDGKKELLNFFDKKFKVGTWYEYVDNFYQYSPIDPYSFYKRGIEVGAFLSTPEENQYLYTSVDNLTQNYTKVYGVNPNKGYSIDIVVSFKDINNQFLPLGELGFSLDINKPSIVSPDSSPTSSGTQSNILDIKNAYIIDSDFESGIFEKSNWNSGYNINYSNDVNITTPTNEGGKYNLTISTSSATITANTLYNTFNKEVDDYYLKEGEVVFLNSVYYDTTGKVNSIIITGSGSNYPLTASNVPVLNGLGTNLTVDITSTVIGSVIDIDPVIGPLATPGGFGYSSNTGVTTSTTGSGVGLTLDIVVIGGGTVSSATVNNPGSGYNTGDVVTINGGSSTAEVTISSINNGEVIAATISNGGIQYNTGDILTIDLGNQDATIQVISTTGSVDKLPDSYKITNNTLGTLTLKEINNSTYSVFTNLLDGGLFYTKDAKNRWGYLHRSKFFKSKIKSGLFRRTYINNSLIQNPDLDLTDIDFNNLKGVKKLLISDGLLSNNSNLLDKATYINSNFVSSDDRWVDGLFYKSVWNSGTFSKGLLKDSSWENGHFKSGKFYNSKSFNAQPDVTNQFYESNRILTYNKSGLTTATISNDRRSWKKGVFESGEFLKSDWESGEFLNGKFYNSKWYSGTFSNGFIGDSSINQNDTKFYNGLINYAIVENASIFAEDTSYSGLSNSTILWKNGVFNSGEFGSNIIQSTASHVATWEKGTFNGGEFKTNAKWKYGTFNGGKFTSAFGWTYTPTWDSISSSASQYAWEDGIFNGGEFGNAQTSTNSNWFTGEFNGGIFKGRVWYNGVLTAGEFNGSSTYSAIGGYDINSMSASNVIDFAKSYTQSFYGLWNSGYVTNVKDEFIRDIKLFSPIERASSLKKPVNIANIKNALWLSGTFSHPSGKMYNSVWLDGAWIKGTFENSSFNPYVNRPNISGLSFNINDDIQSGSGSCIWYNGTLIESEFYVSQWETGKFNSGTAFGMVWRNGVTNYMNAYNVIWEDGLWKNGNWNGSYIDFEGDVTNDFHVQLLYRGMSWSGTSSCHIWDVFTETGIVDSQIGGASATSSISNGYSPDVYTEEHAVFEMFTPPAEDA